MTRKEMLDETAKCVLTDRETQYGTPENNFNKIAGLWTAYSGREYTALDVAMYLSLLKVARIATGQVKDDNFVDLAGYCACGCEIATKPVKKKRPTCAEIVLEYYGDNHTMEIACNGRNCEECPLCSSARNVTECSGDILDSDRLYMILKADLKDNFGIEV